MTSVFIKAVVVGGVILGLCFGQGTRAAKQSARTPLTFAQIEQLIKIGTPDEVISQEVRDRGVAVAPTRSDLDRLTGRGAGAQTLAALRAFAKGVLNVTSRPSECDVLIDNKLIGRTRADGRLVVADVAAGEHVVRVQKDGYQAAEFPITLDPGGQASVAAALETAAGSLTVLTSVPDATIRINGVGTYRGAARNIRCPAGSYVIEVAAPRYAPVSRTVAVPPGQSAQVDVTLEPDAAALEDLRQQLRSSSGGRNVAGTVRAAEELLRYAPSDPEATAALATGHFLSGDAAGFRSTAPKALGLGGSINLRLLHHHAFMAPHEAALGIHSGGITFDPLGATCSIRAGKLAAERIAQVQVARERVRDGQRFVYADFIDIQFRAEGRDNKTSSMKVTATDSRQASVLNVLAEVIQGISKR